MGVKSRLTGNAAVGYILLHETIIYKTKIGNQLVNITTWEVYLELHYYWGKL